jgi:hypothetical protein
VHYCVANIPGAVARTSTIALTAATLPYLTRVAANGIAGAASWTTLALTLHAEGSSDRTTRWSALAHFHATGFMTSPGGMWQRAASLSLGLVLGKQVGVKDC